MKKLALLFVCVTCFSSLVFCTDFEDAISVGNVSIATKNIDGEEKIVLRKKVYCVDTGALSYTKEELTGIDILEAEEAALNSRLAEIAAEKTEINKLIN